MENHKTWVREISTVSENVIKEHKTEKYVRCAWVSSYRSYSRKWRCKSYIANIRIQLPLLSTANIVSLSYHSEKKEDKKTGRYVLHIDDIIKKLPAEEIKEPDVQLRFSLSMLQRYNLKWRPNQESNFIETLEHLLIPTPSICHKAVVNGKDDAFFCEGHCQKWLHRVCTSVTEEQHVGCEWATFPLCGLLSGS